LPDPNEESWNMLQFHHSLCIALALIPSQQNKWNLYPHVVSTVCHNRKNEKK
jgi:hypothetical protein